MIDRWLHRALIVPAAHTRVLDRELQAELYEVFHTRPVARWGHALCTPVVNVALLALAAHFPGLEAERPGALFALDGAVIAGLVTLLGYVIAQGAVALAMAPVLAVAVLLAQLLAGALSPPWLALVVYLAALAQTLTHAPEPVPPPWSGSYGWLEASEFLRRTSWLRLLGFGAVTATIYTLLELWASPRIWPLQLAHFAMRFGFFPERAARLRARVAQILADARNGWHVPPPPAPPPPQAL